MNSLEEAWNWFQDARNTLRRMLRIGERYWGIIPWDNPPWSSDNQFRGLEQEDITDPAQNALQHLNDLAIVVLFSVFEAAVRSTILEQIEQEELQLIHPVLRKAAEQARDRIGEGSFYNVLESYKGRDNNLIEEVNQVRKYRNWVAHGKRGTQPAFVAPEVAYDRLNRFLAIFFAKPIIDDAWIESLREVGD